MVFSLLKISFNLDDEGFNLRLISMNALLRLLLSEVHESVCSFFHLNKSELQVLFGSVSLRNSVPNHLLILHSLLGLFGLQLSQCFHLVINIGLHFHPDKLLVILNGMFEFSCTIFQGIMKTCSFDGSHGRHSHRMRVSHVMLGGLDQSFFKILSCLFGVRYLLIDFELLHFVVSFSFSDFVLGFFECILTFFFIFLGVIFSRLSWFKERFLFHLVFCFLGLLLKLFRFFLLSIGQLDEPFGFFFVELCRILFNMISSGNESQRSFGWIFCLL